MREIKNEYNKVWWSSILTSLIFVVVGILLIIYPATIIRTISVTVGIGIIIAGVFAFIRFFRTMQETGSRNYFRFDVVYGTICAIAGTLLIVNTTAMASILPLVVGVWMTINSIIKIQYVLTIRQFNREAATPTLVIAILTLACGILLIFNPFKGVEILTQILGGFITVYAVLDIVNAFLIKQRVKTYVSQTTTIVEVKSTRSNDEVDEIQDAEIIEEKPKKKKNQKKS